MNNRIQYIDRLKGMAILLVVIGHLMAFCTRGERNPIYEVICAFHMPLFMFLSGLVMSHTPPHCFRTNYLWKKALRFMLPMLWFGLLFTYTGGKDLMAFAADRYKQGYWYLYILTLFYLLMFVYSKLPSAKRPWLLDIAYLAFWQVAFMFADRVLGQNVSDITGISMCRGYWLYFFLGYMVRRHGWAEWLSVHNWLFTLALVSYVPLLYAFETGIIVRFGQVLPLTAIIVLVYLFRLREHETSRVERSLSTIGRSTLDIYVLHYFVLRIINLTDVAAYLHRTSNYLLELVLLVCMALAVAGVCMFAGKVLRQSNIIRGVVYGEMS